MRDIRFRAWDNIYEKMFLPTKLYYELTNDSPSIIGGAYDGVRKCTCQDFELMQYTGIKDSRGVDIYEGDIVEFARGRYQVSHIM